MVQSILRDDLTPQSEVDDLRADKLTVFADAMGDSPVSRVMSYIKDKRANSSGEKLSLDELRENNPNEKEIISRFTGPVSQAYLDRVARRAKERKLREFNYKQLEKEDAYMDYTFGEGLISFGGSMLSEIGDPINLAFDAMIAVNVVNRGFRFLASSKKASKLSRMINMEKLAVNGLSKKQGAVVGFLESAIGNLAADSVAYGLVDLKDGENYTAQQFAISMGASAIFGGGLGAAFSKTRLDDIGLERYLDGSKLDPTSAASRIDDTAELVARTPESKIETVDTLDEAINPTDVDAYYDSPKGETMGSKSDPDAPPPIRPDMLDGKLEPVEFDNIKDIQKDLIEFSKENIAEIDKEINDLKVNNAPTPENVAKVEALELEKAELQSRVKETKSESFTPEEKAIDEIDSKIKEIETEDFSPDKDAKIAELEAEKVKLQDKANNISQDKGFKRLIKEMIEKKELGRSPEGWRRRITNAVFPFVDRKGFKFKDGRVSSTRYSADGRSRIKPIGQQTVALPDGDRVNVVFELQHRNGSPMLNSKGEPIRGGQNELGALYFDKYSKTQTRAEMVKTIALEKNYVKYEIDGVDKLAESIHYTQKLKGINTDVKDIEASLIAKYVNDVNRKELAHLNSKKDLPKRKVLRREILEKRLAEYDTSPAKKIIQNIDGSEVDKRIARLYDASLGRSYRPVDDIDARVAEITKFMSDEDAAKIELELKNHSDELEKAIKDYDVCSLTGELPDE